jgi:hypothetical protein
MVSFDGEETGSGGKDPERTSRKKLNAELGLKRGFNWGHSLRQEGSSLRRSAPRRTAQRMVGTPFGVGGTGYRVPLKKLASRAGPQAAA